MPSSNSQFKQGNKQSTKHGVHSLMQSGPERLPAEKISRLQELRELVKDEPGRAELRRELTARMAMVCELGFSHLRQQAESGDDIWQGGIIRRLASYVSETRRLLDSFENNQAAGLNAEVEHIIKVVEAQNDDQ